VRHSSKKYLEKVLRRKAGRAISDYRMISAGDRVLVAVSGGRDSLVMMKVLALLRKVAPVDFDIVPVHVRTGYEAGFDRIENWIGQTLGYETVVYDSLISQILETTCDKDKSPCALCSRLRRGALYGLAEERGGSSIALGAHRDDVPGPGHRRPEEPHHQAPGLLHERPHRCLLPLSRGGAGDAPVPQTQRQQARVHQGLYQTPRT